MIVRTAAEGIPEADIAQDMAYLAKLWEFIQRKQKVIAVPSLIFEELPLPQRVIRDLANADTTKISVDSREIHAKLQEFVMEFVPSMQNKVIHYPGERPIFDLYNVEDDIQKALQTRVALKSGGYLMIDQTEAMTTIDVNTGSYVGGEHSKTLYLKPIWKRLKSLHDSCVCVIWAASLLLISLICKKLSIVKM